MNNAKYLHYYCESFDIHSTDNIPKADYSTARAGITIITPLSPKITNFTAFSPTWHRLRSSLRHVSLQTSNNPRDAVNTAAISRIISKLQEYLNLRGGGGCSPAL